MVIRKLLTAKTEHSKTAYKPLHSGTQKRFVLLAELREFLQVKDEPGQMKCIRAVLGHNNS
jgi:hypothetical protein